MNIQSIIINTLIGIATRMQGKQCDLRMFEKRRKPSYCGKRYPIIKSNQLWYHSSKLHPKK